MPSTSLGGGENARVERAPCAYFASQVGSPSVGASATSRCRRTSSAGRAPGPPGGPGPSRRCPAAAARRPAPTSRTPSATTAGPGPRRRPTATTRPAAPGRSAAPGGRPRPAGGPCAARPARPGSRRPSCGPAPSRTATPTRRGAGCSSSPRHCPSAPPAGPRPDLVQRGVRPDRLHEHRQRPLVGQSGVRLERVPSQEPGDRLRQRRPRARHAGDQRATGPGHGALLLARMQACWQRGPTDSAAPSRGREDDEAAGTGGCVGAPPDGRNSPGRADPQPRLPVPPARPGWRPGTGSADCAGAPAARQGAGRAAALLMQVNRSLATPSPTSGSAWPGRPSARPTRTCGGGLVYRARPCPGAATGHIAASAARGAPTPSASATGPLARDIRLRRSCPIAIIRGAAAGDASPSLWRRRPPARTRDARRSRAGASTAGRRGSGR